LRRTGRNAFIRRHSAMARQRLPRGQRAGRGTYIRHPCQRHSCPCAPPALRQVMAWHHGRLHRDLRQPYRGRKRESATGRTAGGTLWQLAAERGKGRQPRPAAAAGHGRPLLGFFKVFREPPRIRSYHLARLLRGQRASIWLPCAREMLTHPQVLCGSCFLTRFLG
jgi:hypothetical protein